MSINYPDDLAEICFANFSQVISFTPIGRSCSEQLRPMGARARGALKLRPTQFQCAVPRLSRK